VMKRSRGVESRLPGHRATIREDVGHCQVASEPTSPFLAAVPIAF
jgi:hypothetical protein